ncbi:MAG: EamA/RhaT family transporter [Gammaproteobacteria bacterium]|nr:MAG: EamA/RhaT family transporter [Gammaproteobacteria bacterium]
MTKNSLKYYSEFLLLSVAIAWGVTFLVVQDALDSIGVLAFLFWRFGFAALLIAVLFYKKINFRDLSDVKKGITMGVFLFAGFAGQTYGLVYTTASIVAFITGLYVVMVPFFAFVLFGEIMRKMIIVSATIAALGMYFMSSTADGLSIGIGEIFTFFCAIAFALHLIFTGKFCKTSNNFSLVFYQLLTVSVLSMVLSLFIDQTTFNVSFNQDIITAMIITTIFATVYAFFVLTFMQQHTSATRAGIILAMEPVSAAIYAYFAINEILTNSQLFGASLLVLAFIVAEIRFKETFA